MEYALYYPYMIPPLDWMKQSLLFFDKISSLVPLGYRAGRAFPRKIANRENTRNLRWLETEGHWEPSAGDYLINYPYSRNPLFQTIQTLADAKLSQTDESRVQPSLMVSGKLSDRFRQHLLSSGLARADGEYLILPTYALYAIQSVIAMLIADEFSDYGPPATRVTTSTDSAEYFRFATEPLRRSHSSDRNADISGQEREAPERSDCYQILLDGLLPVPGPNASLPDVIAFRDSHRDELLAFRSAVNEMLREALQAPSPMDVIMDHRTDIELALTHVHKAAHSRRMQLGAAAVTVATTYAATKHFGGQDAIEWVFDGIGAAIAMALTARAMRLPAEKNEFSYLVRAHDLQG